MVQMATSVNVHVNTTTIEYFRSLSSVLCPDSVASMYLYLYYV